MVGFGDSEVLIHITLKCSFKSMPGFVDGADWICRGQCTDLENVLFIVLKVILTVRGL